MRALYFSKKINLNTYYMFIRELSILSKNGIRIADALNLIYENLEDKRLKKVIFQIKKELLNGSSLYDSFLKYENYFDSNLISMIKIGEKTASLSERLDDLEKILLNKLENRKKLISIIIYPIIVIFFALALIIFIIKLILPNFIEIFEENEIALPSSTKVLIYIYNNFNLICFITLIIIFSMYLFNKIINKNYRLSLARDRLIFKIPIINKILKYSTAVKLFKSISILLKAGIGIYEIFNILKNDIKNRYILLMLERIFRKIKLGENIGSNLKIMKLVPNNYYELISIGEEVGDITKQLDLVAKIIESDLELYKKRILVVLEPLIMLFLGLIVAFILVSIYLPILNMNNLI